MTDRLEWPGSVVGHVIEAISLKDPNFTRPEEIAFFGTMPVFKNKSLIQRLQTQRCGVAAVPVRKILHGNDYFGLTVIVRARMVLTGTAGSLLTCG